MIDKEKSAENNYDDDNIPEIDLPKESWNINHYPESESSRKNGSGGNRIDQQ